MNKTDEEKFRIRKIEPGVKNADTAAPPIGIHLPHNSLLSMPLFRLEDLRLTAQ